jgi:hypothetical protein
MNELVINLGFEVTVNDVNSFLIKKFKAFIQGFQKLEYFNSIVNHFAILLNTFT